MKYSRLLSSHSKLSGTEPSLSSQPESFKPLVGLLEVTEKQHHPLSVFLLCYPVPSLCLAPLADYQHVVNLTTNSWCSMSSRPSL